MVAAEWGASVSDIERCTCDQPMIPVNTSEQNEAAATRNKFT